MAPVVSGGEAVVARGRPVEPVEHRGKGLGAARGAGRPLSLRAPLAGFLGRGIQCATRDDLSGGAVGPDLLRRLRGRPGQGHVVGDGGPGDEHRPHLITNDTSSPRCDMDDLPVERPPNARCRARRGDDQLLDPKSPIVPGALTLVAFLPATADETPHSPTVRGVSDSAAPSTNGGSPPRWPRRRSTALARPGSRGRTVPFRAPRPPRRPGSWVTSSSPS